MLYLHKLLTNHDNMLMYPCWVSEDTWLKMFVENTRKAETKGNPRLSDLKD